MRVPGEPAPDLSKPIEELRARIYPELAGLRLDRALTELMPWRSRSSVQRLIAGGYVALEPAAGGDTRRADPARRSARVRAEDIVVVRVPPRAVAAPADRDNFELEIVHEDEWLVAIDKPAGLAVHPSGGRLSGTLINLLHARYRSRDPTRDVVPRLCHRLDRETSGLVLVAKDELAHADVRRQFEAMSVQKSYLAIVEGTVAADTGRIEARLGPARRSPIRLKIECRDDGLSASTRWCVRARARGLTLVECFPKTGRQHQIRVHLASIGHPVVGDKLYGPDERYFLDALAGRLSDQAQAELRLDRHALHSHRLSFLHPRSGEPVELEAPLPAAMRALTEPCS